MIIEPTPPWILSQQEANQMRSRQKFWTVKFEVGKRSVICRECGDTIAIGQRLSIKHLDLPSRTYDLVGYCHISREVCKQNLLVNSCIDAQVKDAEKMLIDDPSLAEEA